MTRLRRKARGPRSNSFKGFRRNPSAVGPEAYGIFPPDVERLGKTATRGLVLFPVHPWSAIWAADYIQLEREYRPYFENLQKFVALMQEFDPERAAEVISPKFGFDETVIASSMSDLVMWAEQAAKDDESITPAEKRALDLIPALVPSFGLLEEWQAVQPRPQYGILQGAGIIEAGFQIRPTFEDRILSLALRVKRLAQGVGYPVEVIGSINPGTVTAQHAVFFSLGGVGEQLDAVSTTGLPIVPAYWFSPESIAAAAGIIRVLLMAGLWDFDTNEWASGTELRFALPMPVLAKEFDMTLSSLFVGAVAPKWEKFQGPSLELSIFYSPTNKEFSGSLTEGGKHYPVKGNYDDEQKVYLVRIDKQEGSSFWHDPEQACAFLQLMGQQPLRLALEKDFPQRPLPGPDFEFPAGYQPIVVKWLKSGVDLLMRQLSPSTETVLLKDDEQTLSIISRGVQEKLHPEQAARILSHMKKAIDDLPIDFVGPPELVGPDKKPRYLPGEGELGLPSYYGSPPEWRRLVNKRLSCRAAISGTEAHFNAKAQRFVFPPTLAALAIVAEKGAAGLPGASEKLERRARGKARLLNGYEAVDEDGKPVHIPGLRDLLRMDTVVGLEEKEVKKWYQKTWDMCQMGACEVPEERERPEATDKIKADALSLTDRSSAICSAVFTLYGYALSAVPRDILEDVGTPVAPQGIPRIRLPFTAELQDAVLSGAHSTTVCTEAMARASSKNQAAPITLQPGDIGYTKIKGKTVYIRGAGTQTFEGKLLYLYELSLKPFAQDGVQGSTNPRRRFQFRTRFNPAPQGVIPYPVLWQSPPLSLEDLSEIIETIKEAFPGESDEGEPFSPIFALRMWLAKNSGLLDIIKQWDDIEKGPPAPFLLVGTILVDTDRLEKAKAKCGKPQPIGTGLCNGRKTSLGLLLTSIKMPSKPDSPLPNLDALTSPYGNTKYPGLYTPPIGSLDLLRLSENFVQVGYTKDRRLLPLMKTPWQKPNIFSFESISRQQSYIELKADLDKEEAELAEKEERAPKSMETRAYYATVSRGLSPFFAGGGISGAVLGARAGHEALGGAHGRIKTVGKTKTQKGQQVSPDVKTRTYGTRPPTGGGASEFGFAKTLIRSEGVRPLGGIREAVDVKRQEQQKGLATLSGPILIKMSELGIEIPDEELRYENPQVWAEEAKRALQELRDAVQVEYEHKMEVGAIVPQVRAIVSSQKQGIEDESDPTYIEQEEKENFVEDYFDEMSRLNPERNLERNLERGGRMRKPRRERHSRHSRYSSARARYNPKDDGSLTPDEVALAVEYAHTGPEGKRDIAAQLQDKAFKDLEARKAILRSSSLTFEQLDKLFPSAIVGGVKSYWSPKNRFQAFTEYPLVSRVGPLDANSEVVRKGRSAAETSETPLSDDDFIELAMTAGGLSLDEAVAILRAQHSSRPGEGYRGSVEGDVRLGKGRRAMQPSSALSRRYRSRKLSAYELPRQVFEQVGSDVLLWMSPQGSLDTRVMTYKRRTHVDLDLVGKGPAELAELLGKAIQSALYWIAEKKQRAGIGINKSGTRIYVGRAGDPDLILIWQPGEDLSLARVTENLKSGRRIPLYGDNITDQKRLAKSDREAYFKAVAALFGADRAREQKRAPRSKTRSSGITGESSSEAKSGTESTEETQPSTTPPKVASVPPEVTQVDGSEDQFSN